MRRAATIAAVMVGAAGLALAAGSCGGGAAKRAEEPATAEAGEQQPDGHGHGHGHGMHGHVHGGPANHRFEDAEQWAKVFDDPARDAWQRPDAVVALTEVAPGATVVDLGAGTGYFVARLSAAAGPSGRVIATDVEPDMVRYLEERAAREGLANVEARLTAPDDPGLADGSVDRVLVVDVWHHLGDRRAYAQRLAAALRPGGRVVVVDFTAESPVGPPPEHRLAPEAIIADLEAAGLDASTIAEELPHQYVVVGRRP